MTGFRTKNSTYYVNQTDKTITGGYFGKLIVPYKHLQAIVGSKAKIQLHNGDVVETSTIVDYL